MDKIRRIDKLTNELDELSLKLFEYINNGVEESELQHIPDAVAIMNRIDEVDAEINSLVDQQLDEINKREAV